MALEQLHIWVAVLTLITLLVGLFVATRNSGKQSGEIQQLLKQLVKTQEEQEKAHTAHVESDNKNFAEIAHSFRNVDKAIFDARVEIARLPHHSHGREESS